MQLLIDGKHALGECILWCERTGRLFWTDILASRLWIHVPSDNNTQSWPMPEPLASFSLTDDDDCLLLGLASQLAFFRLSTAAITPICPVEAELADTRINDGRCDRQGRFVFGTFNQRAGNAPIGSFYRLHADLRLERLPLAPVGIANAICFSPDGRTMYHGDSATGVIGCCDLDPVSGALTNDRVFADLRDEYGDPDGAVVDADGFLWCACWGGSQVIRFAPDGSVARRVPAPARQPSCVTFGGADLATLFVSSARVGLSAADLLAQPGNGGIFSIRPGNVRGLPANRFAGSVPD
jgi:L-arabinonolactonase